MGRKLEFISALQIFTYGFWILLPWDTFGKVAALKILLNIAPEWIFGAIPVSIALGWFLCRRLSIRQTFAVLAMTFWLLMGTAVLISNFYSTAFVLYITNVVIASMAFNEINKEARWMEQV